MLSPKQILSISGVRQNHNVLDLGCGAQGYFTYPSSKTVGVKGKVFAVDIHKPHLDHLMSQAKIHAIPNILPIQTNIELKQSLKPFVLDEQVDVTLFINTLSSLQNKQEIFHELYRALKPDAKLLCIEWKLLPFPIGPSFEKRIDRQTMIRLARNASFDVLKTFEVSNYHYGVLFTRLDHF